MNEIDATKTARDLIIFYTPIYKIPLRTKVLGAVERGLVALFATYDDHGCFWTQSELAKQFECGPRQLRRALLRLQFVKMIAVKQGARKPNSPRREPNKYTFITDPYRWRLTKDIQTKIIGETIKMGKEPKAFVHEPFNDALDLEINFLKEYPRAANKKKGRKKKSTEKINKPVVVTPVPPPKIKNLWRQKIAEIFSDEMSFARLARIYRQNYEAVELARNAIDHGFSDDEKEYYEKLHHIFMERNRTATADEMKSANAVKNWDSLGLSEETVLEMLEKLEQQNKGGNNETGI